METSLEALDHRLYSLATHELTAEQRDFIQSKWKALREYACQNAGFKHWGSHLLKADQTHLDQAFETLIQGIEMTGFQLWKSSAKDPHLEAIFRLFFDDESSFKDVDLSKREKLALFWQYDASIIAQYRTRFEQIFKDLYAQMVWNHHDPLVTEMLIGNLISLYPLFDPPPEHDVTLLENIGGEWQLVRYRTALIPLVENKILAYGLIPANNPHAIPLILFCGTPYPAARGFWEAVKSDLHPFRSVGESIFIRGKPELEKWMGQKPHVKCYGLSLGGALAYHLGKAFGDRVTIRAYAPPGLFPANPSMQNIHGMVFYHVDDFVSSLGYHPTGDHFKCYGVITEANRNFLLAHARPVGCNPTAVIEVNPFHDNQKMSRHVLTVSKHIVSTLLFILVMPLRILIDLYWSIVKMFK